MANCMYIGGFAGSVKARDRIVDALSRRYDKAHVEGFTLSYATSHPEVIHDAVRKADMIFTHSAGILIAIDNATDKQTIHAIAPPIPRRLRDLTFLRSLQQTGWSQHSHHATELARHLGIHNLEAMFELILHPITNLMHALRISRFNVLDRSISMRLAGIAFMEHDAYFIPGPEFADVVAQTKKVVMLRGEHDEFQLDPDAVLEEYFSKLEQI